MAFHVPRTPEDLVRRRIAIIGAGPTGLGAATRLVELGARDVTIFEREVHAGGLASSFVDDAGFTWDVGGHVQFSHYERFDRAMDEALEGEWLTHDREAWIWIRERFVPYPLQYNIHLLPDAEKRECLRGLLRRLEDQPPRHLEGWLRAHFGKGLAETFLLPYNEKVWAYPPSTLAFDWVGDRVAAVDLERVVLNLLDTRPDTGWGPNRRFRYPLRGGTGEIWRRMAARLPTGLIRFGAAIEALDLHRRELRLTTGAREPWDVLISTMPLDDLARMAGDPWRQSADRLVYSTVHVVGIGLSGAPPVDYARKCWIYFPEPVCPFYRLTVFSNYSPSNVPDPAAHWSVMVEVSESAHAPVDRSRLVDDVVAGLLRSGVMASRGDVVSCWTHTAPHGYPTPFLGRDPIVDPLLEGLETEGVFSRGRFGAWKYEVSNQDHSFMQGIELVDRLATGAEEVTLRRPALVNGR